VFDAAPAAIAEALVAIRRSVEALEQAGLLSDSSGILGRIQGAERLEEALSDSDWVQENVPERIDAKIQVFRTLDLAAPCQAVLASSTSSLPPSQFLAELAGRDRCIVAHPFNPPHIVPAVELVRTPWLADASIERCRAFLASCGQVPVVLAREIFGFAFNR
jgi:3-hydroxyacyl-CoA dehydrogenase